MTGHSIRVTKLYCESWVLEAMTGDDQRDPVRGAACFTVPDAVESFEMLIGAMKYPL